MRKLLVCMGMCLLCLGVSSTAHSRPPFCEVACCNGHGTPTTQCIAPGGIVVTCGPPYAYFCP